MTIKSNFISSKLVSFVSPDFPCLLCLLDNGSPLRSEEGRRANKGRRQDFLDAGAIVSCGKASNEGAVRPPHKQASVFRLHVASPLPHNRGKKNGKEAPFQAQHITGNIGKYGWEFEPEPLASSVC